jgi:hypothetical protein
MVLEGEITSQKAAVSRIPACRIGQQVGYNRYSLLRYFDIFVGGQNSPQENYVRMASPVIAFSQLANEFEGDGLSPHNAERLAGELAKTFNVQLDEVAILKLEKTQLNFVYPTKLGQVGSIPLNTSTSVAARTANTKRAEAINNFAQTKHASVFESVKLGEKKTDPSAHPTGGEKHVIQKLMTVPVVGPTGALGVIQVSRKGTSAPTAGNDFTQMDLQKLVTIATALAKCFK